MKLSLSRDKIRFSPKWQSYKIISFNDFTNGLPLFNSMLIKHFNITFENKLKYHIWQHKI